MGTPVSETPQLDAFMAEMKRFCAAVTESARIFRPILEYSLAWERYVADLSDSDAAFMRRYQRQQMRHRRRVRQGR